MLSAGKTGTRLQRRRLDEAGLSARLVADQLGHARPSMTQDVYFARKVVDKRAADALEGAFGVPKQGADEDEADQIEDGPPDAAA